MLKYDKLGTLKYLKNIIHLKPYCKQILWYNNLIFLGSRPVFSYILIQDTGLPVKHGLSHLYKYNTHHVQYITNIDCFFLSLYLTWNQFVKVEYALWRSPQAISTFLSRHWVDSFMWVLSGTFDLWMSLGD